MHLARVDLPEPLSPTTPSVCEVFRSKEMSSTALKLLPPLILNSLFKFLTCKIISSLILSPIQKAGYLMTVNVHFFRNFFLANFHLLVTPVAEVTRFWKINWIWN